MLMIEKIANELGLELGQEFILYGSKYKFNKNSLLIFNGKERDIGGKSNGRE